MRGMIIGVSALAITALPTLALADGNGAAGGIIGGVTSDPGQDRWWSPHRPGRRFLAAAEP